MVVSTAVCDHFHAAIVFLYFFSIQTFASFACCTQANNGATCAERFEFADAKKNRQELKQWKSNQLDTFLGNPSRWKDLREYLPRSSGRRRVIYPHVDDFASMLEVKSSLCWRYCSWARVNHCKDQCA